MVVVKVSVTNPDPLTVEDPNVAVSPGEAVADRLTVPLKPLSPVTVRVELPDWPALKARLFGDAVRVKSVTLTVTRTEWESEPLVAVTLTT